MGLASYESPSRSLVIAKGSEVALHPLSASDLALILNDHGSFINEAVQAYSPALIAGDFSKSTEFASHLLTRSPGLLAALIAYSAREPQNVAIAAALPFGVQVQALAIVVELTLAHETPAAIMSEFAKAIEPLVAELGLTRH